MPVFSLLVLIALVAAAVVYVKFWPFTPQAITKRLHEHTSAVVEFGSFRQVYFPRPGFVAEQVVLRRNRGAQPALIAQRVTVLSSYAGLLSHSLSSVHAEGLIVRVYTHDPAQKVEFHSSGKQSNLTLDHLTADGALLQVITSNPARPASFAIDRLHADHIGRGQTTNLDLIVRNPLPAMTIAANLKLGPWHSGQAMLTPVSGTLQVNDGDLGTVHGIGGKFSGAAKFTGTIQEIAISGNANADGFETQHAQHPVPLAVQYTAQFNLQRGIIQLSSIAAQLGRTTIAGHGNIATKSPSPHIVDLQLTCERGRVEDLLRLFTTPPRPSMTGPIRFQTRAMVEHGDKPFLQRVRLVGNFTINDAQFTSPHTKEKLQELEARSQGDPQQKDTPERAISLISSNVDMKDGIAELSDIRFKVPGADANGNGTFSVLNSEVKIHGKVRMAAQLSQATKGVKSVILKALDPFFKKKGAGAELPVAVTGRAPKAKFKVGLKK